MTEQGESSGGSEWSSTTLRETLDSIDAASNYADWVVSFADPYLGDRVLEVGAGVGTLTPRLLGPDGWTRVVDACEPDPVLAELLEERYGAHPRVTVERRPVQDLPQAEPFDSAVFINVLEHIDDDVDALAATSAVLRPGGHVYVYSPAFPLLMSDFDRSIGHCRRYRKAGLRRAAQDAGLDLVSIRYVNLPGWFAWLLVARLLRRNPTSSDLAGAYDRWFVPGARAVESRVAPPFGQSLAMIARKR